MAGGPDTDPHDVGLAETQSPDPNATKHSQPPAPADDAVALGDRPVSDRLVRAVSRAKIAGALFASDERVKLGRYHLLELVGSGGMGVVWGAWDPELDRRVAIKLVKATMQAARDRILLEGQALAKLSHPNVVPVFDVGVVEEQVYLVMEWVKGKNLRAYCKEPRTVREIVAVYRDAALGLAAAHHAGLIHRDFKPDNAIRGDDGRVRVLDFGLARGETRPRSDSDDTPTPSSDLTRGAGTPRYMPPEQAQGGALTPAVDQYAFCVSLREALVGRDADGKDADLPGWLDAICTRGTAHDVKTRFPSMDDLLRALGRDPRTIWRRRAIATGALALAGAAFAIGTVRGGSAQDTCTGGKAEIAKTWNDQVRTALFTHVGSLGEYGKEESKRVDDALTAYSTGWADAHRGACKARERAELTPQMYERSVGCLARANTALQTVIGVLSNVPAERLSDAIVAVHDLPGVQRCATEEASAPVEPPAPAIAADVARVANEVERARVLAVALDPSAPEVAAAAVTEADRLAYAPLRSKAELVLGLSWLLRRQGVDAIAPLTRAMDAAFVAGDDATAVEAYARELFAVSISSADKIPADAAQIAGAAPIMVPIARRLGTGGSFGRALLYNNIGASKLAAAHRDEAETWYRRALDEARLAPGNTELARIPANVALVASDQAEQQKLSEETVARLAEIVGPNHPFTLEAKLIATVLVKNSHEAEASYRDLYERYKRYHPHLVDLSDYTAFEVGWLTEERGDDSEARRWMTLVTSESSLGKLAHGYVLAIDGDFAGSLTAMSEMERGIPKASELWERADFVDLYFVKARCLRALHRSREAAMVLEQAVELLDEAAKAYPKYERRLARARTELARMIIDTNKTRAHELADLAANYYRTTGSDDQLVAELEQLSTR